MNAITQFNRGQVPTGWVEAPADDEGVRFRHGDSGFAVEAVKADDGTEAPSSGCVCRWKLQCRQSAGEARSVKPLRRVATREEAVRALYSWMERINAAFRRGEPGGGVPFGELVEILERSDDPARPAVEQTPERRTCN
ncbi:hypothetical protein [Halegenticoccus soli]|uniref:hypothetical protein n=1 Tax=Halegenticoccus soli TaxID=1985678 RepID=UPI000C6C8BBD|nr:hypothetical protein [Halegenticoccus soli]